MQITNLEHHAPLGKSDHAVIAFEFKCYTEEKPSSIKYCYDKTDFEEIQRSLVDSQWTTKFVAENMNQSTDVCWLTFKAKMYEIREKFVQTRLSGTPHWKCKGDIPISEDIRKAIREKKRLYRQWLSNYGHTSTENRRKAYNKARNKVKTLMRQAKHIFEYGIACDAKRSPKRFWSFVRGKLKTKSCVSPLRKYINDKDSLQFDDKSKANVLNNQFASVFTKEPNDSIPEFPNRTDTIIPNLFITPAIVQKKTRSARHQQGIRAR